MVHAFLILLLINFLNVKLYVSLLLSPESYNYYSLPLFAVIDKFTTLNVPFYLSNLEVDLAVAPLDSNPPG